VKKPNQIGPKKHNRTSPVSSTKERHARARRRLLQSIAAGSAAISVKNVPERWSRPMLDTSILPVHAQTTNCALSCRIATLSPNSFDGDVAVTGFALSGGQTGTVGNFDEADPSTFTITGINATVDPSCTVALDVDLDQNSSGLFAVSGGALQSISNGTATFGSVIVTFNASPDSAAPNATAEVDFTFASNPGNCVINITFAENL